MAGVAAKRRKREIEKGKKNTHTHTNTHIVIVELKLQGHIFFNHRLNPLTKNPICKFCHFRLCICDFRPFLFCILPLPAPATRFPPTEVVAAVDNDDDDDDDDDDTEGLFA